jgi:hypothetical protein
MAQPTSNGPFAGLSINGQGSGGRFDQMTVVVIA